MEELAEECEDGNREACQELRELMEWLEEDGSGGPGQDDGPGQGPGAIDELTEEIEELLEECQDGNSEACEELEEAIDTLEEVAEHLEERCEDGHWRACDRLEELYEWALDTFGEDAVEGDEDDYSEEEDWGDPDDLSEEELEELEEYIELMEEKNVIGAGKKRVKNSRSCMSGSRMKKRKTVARTPTKKTPALWST